MSGNQIKKYPPNLSKSNYFLKSIAIFCPVCLIQEWTDSILSQIKHPVDFLINEYLFTFRPILRNERQVCCEFHQLMKILIDYLFISNQWKVCTRILNEPKQFLYGSSIDHLSLVFSISKLIPHDSLKNSAETLAESTLLGQLISINLILEKFIESLRPWYSKDYSNMNL